MTLLERDGDTFIVDARAVADGLGLAADDLPRLVREGAVTTRCEAGVGEDAGRWRITFVHAGRACRLTVDSEGRIVRRASFPVRTHRVGSGVQGH
ncbi:MAG: DUF6522 family protein [Alphaproteobacteria bacterium]|nr:DUF6522 family protein [Alphaproteobacteria bacterium]MDX5368119.1 DUF6522 family protein [Alphaproteobacteria bacterium]